MNTSKKRFGVGLFLGLSFALSSCRSVQSDVSTDQPSQVMAGEEACIKPVRVSYGFRKKATNAPPESDYLTQLYNQLEVELSFADIATAKTNDCKSGVCKAQFIKPVKVKADLPIALNSRIVVDYEQDHDENGTCVRSLDVGSSVKNYCIGKILNLSVEIGIKGSVKTDRDNKKTYACKISGGATADLTCPLLRVKARMNETGIEFTPTLQLSDIQGWDMAKLPGDPQKSYRISYKDIPDRIKSVIKYFSSKSPKESDEKADVEWERFANICYFDNDLGEG